MAMYLGCAPQQPATVPTVVIPEEDTWIIDKGISREAPTQKNTAKEDADFIVKTLEGKIRENQGTKIAGGTIYVDTSDSEHTISYKFDPREYCPINSKKPLFKGFMEIEFIDDHFVNGTGIFTKMYFSQQYPFYLFKEEFEIYIFQKDQNSYSSSSLLYPAFPEAKKFYQTLLHYIAKNLEGPLKIEKDYPLIIITPYQRKEIGLKGQKILQDHHSVLDHLPKGRPFSGKGITLVRPCRNY